MRASRGPIARPRWVPLAALVALTVGLAVAWPTIGLWTKSALLLTDGVLRLPVRPLTWFTAEPEVELLRWEHDGRGRLWLPGGGPAPGLVLILGADPAGPDDPKVKRLLETLARLGFATLLPLSDELDARVVSSVEVRRLVAAFETLAGHPAVRDDRVAFVGLSAGGSLAIAAAADPAIAARVRFVLAIGPYYDAASLVVATAAEAIRAPGGVEPWEPDGTTRKVVRATLLAALPAEERAAIEAGLTPDSDDGRLVAALVGGLPLAEAEAAVAALSPALRAELEAVSPRYAVDGLRAPLYLLHDRGDDLIPWTESEAINGAHRAAVYHRLDLFEHVVPDVGSVGVLVRDGWRLLRLFERIFREAR